MAVELPLQTAPPDVNPAHFHPTIFKDSRECRSPKRMALILLLDLATICLIAASGGVSGDAFS